ncbi:Hypothetical protein SRAE_0000045900 [Strongyloides ratti]|uniref:F-box domain-containing protein n=1 Tax=Strongyloides ratti TaxID=34506 RepID=A0A090MSQ9_STRRB|nr:Hypothetical protein SRAE_0000045900 [Strongyloides ratti]CEF61333.1 Hypothetical protein SRAE_0000045900 [Strongyloides ratti]
MSDIKEKENDSFNYLYVLSNSLVLKKIVEKLNSYEDLRRLATTCRKLRITLGQLRYRYKNLWYYYEYDDNLVVSMPHFLSNIEKYRYCVECKNFYDETFLLILINEVQPVRKTVMIKQSKDLIEEKTKYLNQVIEENLPRHMSLNISINENFEITSLSALKNFKHIKVIYITKSPFNYKYLKYINDNVEYLDKIVFGESCCPNNQNIIPGIYLNDITDGVQIFKLLYSFIGLLSMIKDGKKLNNLFLTHCALDCIESPNEFEILKEFTKKSRRIYIDIYFNGFRNPSAWLDYFAETTNIYSLTWFVTGYMETSFVFIHPIFLTFMETLTNFGIIYYRDITTLSISTFSAPITSIFYDALRKCFNMESFAITINLFEITDSLSDEVIDRRTNITYKNSFTEFCCKMPPNLKVLYLDRCDILSFDELKLISESSPNIETLILHDLRDSDICDLDKLKMICKNVKYVDFTVSEKYASSIVLKSLTEEKKNESGENKLMLKWPSFYIFTCKFLCIVKGLNNGFNELERNTPRSPGQFIIKTPRLRNDSNYFHNFPSSHHEDYNEIEITIMKNGSFFEQKKFTEIKKYIDTMSYEKINEFQKRYL